MRTIEEQATGCTGAHGYREYAKSLGYKHIEVFDWTSSAGNWQFLVSKDGQEWFMLEQTNNWPRPGFSYAISEESWLGSYEDVCREINPVVDWEGKK